MASFISSGPDIPEVLLQEHEEGRVIFFCGSGISIPAGLPTFKGLVDNVYKQLGTEMTKLEEPSYKQEFYDATLNQLEKRYPGQRIAVRQKLAAILAPNLRKKGARTTHEALLQLATDREGKIRLVTTNYDHIFETVIRRSKRDITRYSAPLLPIPKQSRWDGLVYLHGLLPKSLDEAGLNNLVLTSGDFGLAYLSERWAARFVSELFRSFTVCFVGYSINDPILRYMMDSLAADKLMGERETVAYAFAEYVSDESKEDIQKRWEAKGVLPLLYKIPQNTQDHSALHSTLKEWANTYRDGIHGREMILAEHCSTAPLSSSRSDYAVGRVLWALNDIAAAKHFAELNPVPPLSWLEPLSENQFGHHDLARFGVMPNKVVDEQTKFSILSRPTPYALAPNMSISSSGEARWDALMRYMAQWLTRHLNDPKLLIWLADNGGSLHGQFSSIVLNELERLDKLTSDEIDKIRSSAPNAVPDEPMRILWQLFLAGRIKSNSDDFGLYRWNDSLVRKGLTASLRMKFRELMTPCLRLRARFPFLQAENETPQPRTVNSLVDWDIALSCGHAHSALSILRKSDKWLDVLPELLDDLNLLLRDTFDLRYELDDVDDKSDRSYIVQPSISEHEQNNRFHDWTVLIELVRDAWLAEAKDSPEHARRVAEKWWETPYPLFKRLAFFAAANSDVISHSQALDWLLADGCWWLWTTETQREVLRLLVALSKGITRKDLKPLEAAILAGPPRNMFCENLEEAEWVEIVEHSCWLRLAKLQATRKALSQRGIKTLEDLQRKHPQWQLAEDESDEFPVWIFSGMGKTNFSRTPEALEELVIWLRQNPGKNRYIEEDDWQQRCQSDFQTTVRALFILSKENEWPIDRWREAMQVWSEKQYREISWCLLTDTLMNMPDNKLDEIKSSLAYWLRQLADKLTFNEKNFFSLCLRILALEYENEVETTDKITYSINHPVGFVTDALIRWWYQTDLNDNQKIPECIADIFSDMCDISKKKFLTGRLTLAKHVLALFRVDCEWTKKCLLPLFSWNQDKEEATWAWTGFLWAPRLYYPLLTSLKEQFLETVNHYECLGNFAERYIEFLTFLALTPSNIFSKSELVNTLSKLSAKALETSSHTLVHALEGAGKQRNEYWRNRILPLFHNIWPKKTEFVTPQISRNFAELCVLAGDNFPDALDTFRHWLRPMEHPYNVIETLIREELCKNFPEDALVFLSCIVNENTTGVLDELEKCLDDIKQVNNALATDNRFRKLRQLLNQRGLN